MQGLEKIGRMGICRRQRLWLFRESSHVVFTHRLAHHPAESEGCAANQRRGKDGSPGRPTIQPVRFFLRQYRGSGASTWRDVKFVEDTPIPGLGGNSPEQDGTQPQPRFDGRMRGALNRKMSAEG